MDREVPLYGAILLPPLAVAVTDPDIFFAALDTAGTFGISLLCGVLPAAMAWQQRYGAGADEKIATLPLVPGGKATLAGSMGITYGFENICGRVGRVTLVLHHQIKRDNAV